MLDTESALPTSIRQPLAPVPITGALVAGVLIDSPQPQPIPSAISSLPLWNGQLGPVDCQIPIKLQVPRSAGLEWRIAICELETRVWDTHTCLGAIRLGA